MMYSFIKPLKELAKGLYIVLKNGFKSDVTLMYPEKKKILNDNFRGKIKYNKEKCIKCRLCQKVCPSKGTITIDKEFIIDFSQCIFCANCVENCPKGALQITKEYELASKNKKDLIFKEEIN
ncbi:MAG: NADH-quinone oxidoreductase subunit I [Candidatus Gastranaerophilales bacterium]|nr:NADH-quinone oxidoreductase subunit I [Candidatus Gastranaerophilales bacterium]